MTPPPAPIWPIQRSIAAFEDFEHEDLHEIISGIAEDQPKLFMDITAAIEAHLQAKVLQEMSEETMNGQPLYPELHI